MIHPHQPKKGKDRDRQRCVKSKCADAAKHERKNENRDQFHLLGKREGEQQRRRRRGHKEGRLKREQFPAPT